jgi:hypothetical protein
MNDHYRKRDVDRSSNQGTTLLHPSARVAQISCGALCPTFHGPIDPRYGALRLTSGPNVIVLDFRNYRMFTHLNTRHEAAVYEPMPVHHVRLYKWRYVQLS